ncbi:hypothetical protein swp_0113 [Shewanella piezotolerans WP3]|uniref:Uncharacterized protein n=1 Tax=Shewanella piezotolerans (strain WP3 / JCM 13877) TaxID=225849 RepID=B8CGW4_SHEPW|nr:hypothetical protein swp_0113 [Shewanella piezotolerans WP3]
MKSVYSKFAQKLRAFALLVLSQTQKKAADGDQRPSINKKYLKLTSSTETTTSQQQA